MCIFVSSISYTTFLSAVKSFNALFLLKINNRIISHNYFNDIALPECYRRLQNSLLYSVTDLTHCTYLIDSCKLNTVKFLQCFNKRYAKVTEVTRLIKESGNRITCKLTLGREFTPSVKNHCNPKSKLCLIIQNPIEYFLYFA